MLWISFSLLAAMLWATVNVIDKYTMSKLVQQPLIPVLILGIVGLFSVFGVYCVIDFPLLSLTNLTLSFMAGGCYVLTMYFYYLAMQRDEVSKIIPLYYLAPVFILFMAVEVLHETLTSLQYVGMAFLVSGAIFISMPYPLKFQMNKAAGFMILAAFCYALNQVLTKYLVKEENFWVVFAYVRIGIFLCLLPVLFWAIAKARSTFRAVQPRAYMIMIANQCLNLGGVLCITIAMTYGYVTLVNALASVQPFFVFLFATLLSRFFPHILEEKRSGSIFVIKSMAIALMFCGTLMVS